MKRWVLSFERNVEIVDTASELRVSGEREFQLESWSNDRKGPFIPRDVRTYGMDRTDESDDLVDRE